MRQRDPGLNSVWGTICTPHQFISSDGKRHQANCASLGGILRVIQSVPSPKVEPLKQWLAQVGADRLHQMQDPELGIQQSLADFKRLGYSDNWINQRLKSIEIRKDLTAKEYKQLKGLRKENLRDNMTNEELVMNMLRLRHEADLLPVLLVRPLNSKQAKKVVTDLNMKRFLESQQPQLDFTDEGKGKDE